MKTNDNYFFDSLVTLQIFMVFLKLFNEVDWSWLVVFMPIYIEVFVLIILFVLSFITTIIERGTK